MLNIEALLAYRNKIVNLSSTNSQFMLLKILGTSSEHFTYGIFTFQLFHPFVFEDCKLLFLMLSIVPSNMYSRISD